MKTDLNGLNKLIEVKVGVDAESGSEVGKSYSTRRLNDCIKCNSFDLI